MSASSPSSGTTSTNLLARACLKEATAWRQLIDTYGPLIYSWARRWGLNSDDAKDVMQSVFLTLTTHLPRFHARPDSGSFRGWLFTITRNRVRDYFRRPQVQGTGGTNAMKRLYNVPIENPDRESELRDLGGLRRRALEQVRRSVEPRTWEAFWRTVVEEESPADVAADLNISVWTVYKARARILRRLREEWTFLFLDESPSSAD